MQWYGFDNSNFLWEHRIHQKWRFELAKGKYVVGAGAGAMLGSKIGIAAFGTAFAGTLPLAALGIFVVWMLSKALFKESRGNQKYKYSRPLKK